MAAAHDNPIPGGAGSNPRILTITTHSARPGIGCARSAPQRPSSYSRRLSWPSTTSAPAAKVPPEGGSIDSGPRFRLLVERSSDVFYRIRLTPEPVLEYVSPAAETVTGYSPAELLDDPTLWQELVHPDDRALIPDGASFAAATADELEAPVVLRWVRRDGSVRWTEHRSAPIFAEDGTLIALEGVARDVTARITGEEHVRAADARLRDLLSGIDLGALVLDTSGRVEFINDFLLRLLGRSRDELVGQDWIDIAVPEDERAALREIFAAAVASGAGAGQREDGIVTRSGEERRLLWTSVIQHDADGRVVGLAAIAHDVTEARRIAAEHARLAAAIEQSAESVIITDPATRILYVNRAFERLSGYASAEVVGQTPRILDSGVQSKSYYDAMGAALAHGVAWTADVVYRRKDGSHYRVSSVTSPIWAADGSITGYVDVARDVSHERELESQTEQLVRERALIADTLRSLPSGGDPEATAELFCRQVASLSDIVVASVLGFESDGAASPLAFVVPGSPDAGLRRFTVERSRYLHGRAKGGPMGLGVDRRSDTPIWRHHPEPRRPRVRLRTGPEPGRPDRPVGDRLFKARWCGAAVGAARGPGRLRRSRRRAARAAARRPRRRATDACRDRRRHRGACLRAGVPADRRPEERPDDRIRGTHQVRRRRSTRPPLRRCSRDRP